MSRFPYTAEDREDQLCQLIDARTRAIRTDILLGRTSTIDAVSQRLEGDYISVEAAHAVVQLVVKFGGAGAGDDLSADVNGAIYFEAEALAEKDIADIERNRAEAAQYERIEQRVWNHFFAQPA